MTDARRGTTVVTNLETIVSGDLESGIVDGDTIVIEDGELRFIGSGSDVDTSDADTVIDANGMTASPGLIDPHVHPSIGDWTPRQNAIGWIEATVHGGTTSLLSQGEVQVQGRPSDAAGTKALAILACRTYDTFRPGGAKVHGGAVILQEGLTEDDFAEMAAAGVSRVAEIGGGGISAYDDVKPMLEWAASYGMSPVSVHFGGAAIPTSNTLGADEILRIDPDLIVHANSNGSPSNPPLKQITRMIEESSCSIELVFNGNPKMMYEIARILGERDELNRIVFGSDTPTSLGIVPPVIFKSLVQVASLNGIAPEAAIAMGSGSTADLFGLNTGKIEVGREADLLLLAPPLGFVETDALDAIAAGDAPAVALVIIDGEIVAHRARNTPPTRQVYSINGATVGYPENPDEYLFGGRA